MPNENTFEQKDVKTLHVLLLREMFSEFFTIQLDNGQTEELDPEEVRNWFRVRGANMDALEKVLDQCWNFGRAEVTVRNYKEPPNTRLPYAPDI